jgi:ADP-ribose pyrophosphatase
MDRFSQPGSLTSYFALMQEMPRLFENRGPGSIEILSDPEDIKAAQEAALQMRQSHGLDTSDLRTGLIARDPYMIMLRDAVRFPDGSLGLYNRIVEAESVAVLPLLGDKLVLLRIFRHGLRDWSLEFPRGGCEAGETPEQTARREVREEIGAEIDELIPLGRFTPGGSSLTIGAHFFAARIQEFGEPDRADGIDTIETMSVARVEDLMRDSTIIDGFTLSIFLRARLAGVI